MSFSNAFRLLLALFFLLAPLMPVPQAQAYVDPPDDLSIENVTVFNGLWEEGDWLVVVYYVISGTEPSQAPESLYSVCITDPETDVCACRGVPRYSHGVGSVYLTASDVAELGFDWSDAATYTVTLRGNPSEFDPEEYALHVTYEEYDVNGVDMINYGLAKNASYLCALCTESIAPKVESTTSLELLATNGMINEDEGYEFFIEAIPGMTEICGSCFATSSSYPEAPMYWAHSYLYPDGVYSVGSSIGLSPSEAGSNYYKVINWPFYIRDKLGSVDTGGMDFVTCDEFTQEDDFWNYATLTVLRTNDEAPPQGESAVVVDFTDSTNRFDLSGSFTAAAESRDIFKLDYSNCYIYTTQDEDYSEFIFTLDDLVLPDGSTLRDVAVHYDFSCEGEHHAYVKPVVYSGSDIFYGNTREAYGGGPIFSEAERIDVDDTWLGRDINDFRLGLRCWVDVSSDECRVYKAALGLTYNTTNPERDYEKSLLDNKGNRLKDALEGLGEWLGVPGIVASSLGVALIYFALAGRIFVATGSPAAAVVLGFPFILACVVVGLLQMYLIFIILFTLIILFGITFILARL